MPEPVFSQDWHSHNTPALIEVLAKFKGQPDIQALEIGCFEGRGTLWLLDNILTDPSCTIDCIDTFEGGHEHEFFGIEFTNVFDRFMLNAGSKSGVYTYQGKSSYYIQHLACNERTYQIIYVDGSHMAPDVLTDIILSWDLLHKGGVMFLDDYLWPGSDTNELHRPKIAIDAFLAIYAEQLKVLHKEYSVAVEKI